MAQRLTVTPMPGWMLSTLIGWVLAPLLGGGAAFAAWVLLLSYLRLPADSPVLLAAPSLGVTAGGLLIGLLQFSTFSARQKRDYSPWRWHTLHAAALALVGVAWGLLFGGWLGALLLAAITSVAVGGLRAWSFGFDALQTGVSWFLGLAFPLLAIAIEPLSTPIALITGGGLCGWLSDAHRG